MKRRWGTKVRKEYCVHTQRTYNNEPVFTVRRRLGCPSRGRESSIITIIAAILLSAPVCSAVWYLYHTYFKIEIICMPVFSVFLLLFGRALSLSFLFSSVRL